MTENNGSNYLADMIGGVEERLKLPPGTIQPLFAAEQHWVFVLKTASIVETVLKTAIVARLQGAQPLSLGMLSPDHRVNDGLRHHVFRLGLNGETGAIALGKRFGLVSQADETFIRELAGIRNRYAHSVLNHSRPVMDIVSEGRDINQVKMCLAGLQYGESREYPIMDPGIGEIEMGVLLFLAAMSGRFTPLQLSGIGLLSGWVDPTEQPE